MTPRQLQTMDKLLALGGARPHCDASLADELEEKVLSGTRELLTNWTSRSLYLTKAQVLTALRCEGQLLVVPERDELLKTPTMVGIVSHRAIQLAHTHGQRPVAEYVRQALEGARSDERFTESWLGAGAAAQSDVLMQASSRVVGFLDDWPPLDPAWDPRFEEPLSTRVGRLTLASRVDLVIGRPRADMRQTMMLVDLKSGALRDEHDDEALFYALVSTLRHRVAPWRSLVYSLSSGEYTEPDITAERLFDTADRLVGAVRSVVEVLTEKRGPVLEPGDWCGYCPLRTACPAAATTKVELGASTVLEVNTDHQGS